MQGAFGAVVIGVLAVGVIGALIALAVSRRTWDAYGADHLVLDSDRSGAPGDRARGARGGNLALTPAATAERDEEVRQMLEARNVRRRRRGEPELDVDTELARLTASAPEIDDELRAEIRELVQARNHRRARRGLAPLEVEAEIEREVEALGRPYESTRHRPDASSKRPPGAGSDLAPDSGPRRHGSPSPRRQNRA